MWDLTTVTGGSGTGKTRLSAFAGPLIVDELKKNTHRYLEMLKPNLEGKGIIAVDAINNLIASLEHNYSLYFDFSNGDYFPMMERYPNETLLFAIISRVLCPEKKVSHLFFSKEKYLLGSFSVDSVARALREHYKSPPGEMVTIVCNIDEFQKRISAQDKKVLMTGLGDKDKVFMRRLMLAIMELTLSLSSQNIFLFPIFSGTFYTSDIPMMPATDYNLSNIFLTPIQDESSKQIIKNYLKCDISDTLIETMGNLPRALEFLALTLKTHPNSSDDDVFRETSLLLQRKYPVVSSDAETLVRLCISGKIVKREEICGEQTLRDLESSGIVFLQETKSGYRVLLPFVLAHAWNSQLKMFDSGLLTYVPSAFFQDFELFGREFEVFKNNTFFLSSSSNQVQTTFGERFHGALMSRSLEKQPLVLHKMNGFDSVTDELTSTEIKIVGRSASSSVNILKECACIRIARDNQACDILTSYPGQTDGSTFIRLEEWKSSFSHMEHRQDPSVSLKEIKAEEDRAHSLLPFLAKSESKIFFAFMSNRKLPSNLLASGELKPTTMVVGAEQWHQYFSPMFASFVPKVLQKKKP